MPKIIESEAEREGWARETGARAVDMETAWIAAACEAHKLPLLSLRVISDTPSKPLPAPPEVLFDLEKQRPNITRLAAYLATHPAAFTHLRRFRQQIIVARRLLTAALDRLLRDGGQCW